MELTARDAVVDIFVPSMTACQTSQFLPLFNQRGQSPCTVATNLAIACLGTSIIDLMHPWNTYQLQNSPCACNTVWYSLYDICMRCSGSNSIAFHDYSANNACQNTVSRA
ncbi:hypothetical protein C8Q77DRAFT_382525 [Trametes polyzona]|nr:hypothetical protein C8Q77DRAFT_382525 [Trametes polyzona]